MGLAHLRRQKAFTLLELIVVLALLALLIFLFASAYSGFGTMAQSTSLTTGVDLLRDVLTEGRSSAVAQNTPVEVRIYALPPQPGAPPVYSAIQLHWLKADGTTPPVSRLVSLPSWSVMDATMTHSPLIARKTSIATHDPSDPYLDSSTRSFHFLPDGSTDLNPTINWFVTIRAANQSEPAHFPNNWAAVTINPTTGHIQIYRP